MLKMSRLYVGAVIATLVASVLGTAALTSAFARGGSTMAAVTTATPGNALNQLSDQALRSKWKSVVGRLGFGDKVVSRIERALERLGSDRDDRLFVQLDALLISARRVFGKAQAVAVAHAGFDASGNVMDRAQAVRSIQSLQAELHELRVKLIVDLEQLIG